jgi:uncharacterized lipoprotein YajG
MKLKYLVFGLVALAFLAAGCSKQTAQQSVNNAPVMRDSTNGGGIMSTGTNANNIP